MGTWANFQRELGDKVDSGEQSGILFKETLEKNFKNMGDFRHFPKEHGNTDPLEGLKSVVFRNFQSLYTLF